MMSYSVKMLSRLAPFLAVITFLFVSAPLATPIVGGDHPNQLLPFDIDPTKLTYKLSFLWPQGYCKTRSSGCETVTNLPKHFTMHGLWPIYRAACNDSTAKFNINDVRGIKDNLERNWPDLKYYGNPIRYETFWSNEWERHGKTCAIYTVLGYFSRSLDLLAGSEVLQILEAAGKPTKAEDVKAAFRARGKEPYVRCKLGNNNTLYFYQLEFCLDSSEQYYNCPPTSGSNQCPIGQHFSYGDTTIAFFTNKLEDQIDSQLLSM